MKNGSLLSLFLLWCSLTMSAQTEVKTTEMASLYKTTSFQPTSIHDPSVVWDSKSQQFYIFGSHYAGAKTKDLRNWTGVHNYYNKTFDQAFKSNPTRTVKRVLPGKTDVEEVTFPSFDAAAFCAIYADNEAQWVSGDQWAPDVVWNETMQKWCYYLSLNGDNWASVVVLMTSDNIEGPYTYQGPIVFGGFNNQTYNGKKVDYKKTDLEIVLGTQSSIPSRYRTDKWGSFYPNCIDPCAFFDETGELWLIYGSWSGGIFALKLDKTTGLRDYTVTYSGTATSPQAQGDDAYFGKRIAGGYYVSGEGPYIQHIGDYYYLFMSYGFFAPDGGYEMRVFRSTSPTGPFKDAGGNLATYTGYQLNYGPNAATNRGMKLIGAMNGWGQMTVGECAQGHNSAIVDEQGRNFLVCHTKFNNGTAGHQVRAYQMYLNKQGWLVTAPFQFAGETTTDEYLANNQPYSVEEIVGDYHVLIHPYKLDHANMQEVTPKLIHLTADGKVSGDYTGTWSYIDEGKSYFQIKLAGATYSGVITEQTLENNAAKTICFTGVCSVSGHSACGVPCWGYKLRGDAAIALNYQRNKDRFKNVSRVQANQYLMFDPTDNTTLAWTSSHPEVMDNYGKINPGVESVKVTMNARMESGSYFWTSDFTMTVQPAGTISGDFRSGLLAYYDFNTDPCVNSWGGETAVTGRYGTGTAPTFEGDYDRYGNVLHQYFGAQKSNSYTRIDNPLKDSTIDGFTVSLWVKRLDANVWDALWGFFNSNTPEVAGARMFITGNSYLGFNDNAGNWFDVNHPTNEQASKSINKKIATDAWTLLTLTYSKTAGYTLYANGIQYVSTELAYTGSVATASAFDHSKVMDFVTSSDYFFLGSGSFWGSAPAKFDDLMIYNRALTASDVSGLYKSLTRSNDFTNGIETMPSAAQTLSAPDAIYDLMGRKVTAPAKGIYIVNGKKVLFK